jgi:hypothetical protein
MSPRNASKLLAAAVIALLVVAAAFAIRSAEPDPPGPPGPAGPKVAVVAFGLFGDQSVFESEAMGAAGIVAERFGGGPAVVRANTRSRSDATVATLATDLDSAAKAMDAENDILVLILTSHGSKTRRSRRWQLPCSPPSITCSRMR